ncbi:MAG: serine/threonine-protein kinase [Polyangiaceae bacterium]
MSSLPGEGELFDAKYRIGSVLGIGRTTAVIAAKRMGFDDDVAIKLLRADCCDDPMMIERLVQEGKMAARIRSEHVVRMLTADAFAGRAYLVMEYLDGVTLAELLRRQGPLPLATAVDMLLQACEAISEAHTLGFFHHDLKPASLFLTHRADGSPCVKVLDFGISTVPRIATIAPGSGSRPPPPPAPTGTPQYMSPEQLTAAKVVDQSSDIWSLGAILYELVSGRRAFEGSGVSEIRTHVLHATPVPLGRLRPEIPKELERVVSRCFEKDPLRRHANVAQMAGALAPYGSSAARASAGSIVRAVEGGIVGRSPLSGGVERVTSTVEETLARAPARRRKGRALLIVALAALSVVVGGLAHRARAGQLHLEWPSALSRVSP